MSSDLPPQPRDPIEPIVGTRYDEAPAPPAMSFPSEAQYDERRVGSAPVGRASRIASLIIVLVLAALLLAALAVPLGLFNPRGTPTPAPRASPSAMDLSLLCCRW